ncbi:MAG: hypothetical protein RI993_152 [Pseudomonadota bacterium]|jgi:flagellar biosynthesis protein
MPPPKQIDPEEMVKQPDQPVQPTSMQNAVALSYHSGMTAPKVVAKGKGLVAEEIIRRAQEHGIYVHESPELVTMLMQVDLDDRIPPELYIAVAELLAWLYRLENRN